MRVVYPEPSGYAAGFLRPEARGAEVPAPTGRTRPARAAVSAPDRRYWAGVFTLAGLYALYVAVGAGAWLGVVAVTLATAAAATPLRADLNTQRALVSTALLVLAVLHGRVLHGGVSSPLVQLGFAASVAASAATSLLAWRFGRSAAVSLVVSLALAALFAARFPSLVALVATTAGVLFAWIRPLGALSEAARTLGLHRGPPDPARKSHPQVSDPAFRHDSPTPRGPDGR